jgi:small subunit ribosomal protein S21
LSITVDVRNGNVEKAMRILKRKVQKDGIIQTLRDKQYYQKPSFKRREKIKTAKRMVAKLQKEKDAMNGIVIVKGKKVKKI